MKQLILLSAIVFVVFSCKKDNNDDSDNTPKTPNEFLQGKWKLDYVLIDTTFRDQITSNRDTVWNIFFNSGKFIRIDYNNNNCYLEIKGSIVHSYNSITDEKYRRIVNPLYLNIDSIIYCDSLISTNDENNTLAKNPTLLCPDCGFLYIVNDTVLIYHTRGYLHNRYISSYNYLILNRQ